MSYRAERLCRAPHPTVSPYLMMAASRTPETGVYRFFALIDARPAFFTIDWNGERSDLRVVMEGESEEQVIGELDDWLESSRPLQRPSRNQPFPSRPRLRLL